MGRAEYEKRVQMSHRLVMAKIREKERIELEEYHASTWKRILAQSEESTVPKGFTERCRVWTGCEINSYGKCSYKGRQMGAHRISLMIKLKQDKLQDKNEKGEIFEVRHLCNNSKCVEPTHLNLGTKAENGEDKSNFGSMKGEKHPNAKITENIARKIKLSKYPKDHEKYQTQIYRANLFQVTIDTVKHIDRGIAWSYLPFYDNSTSEDKAKYRNNLEKIRLEKAKDFLWTEDQWKEAKEKLSNPNYIKLHDTCSYGGVPCKKWVRANIAGYGKIYIHGISIYAHILACIIGNNNIRPENLEASHLCNFPLCVESSHLKFKTHEENMRDKIENGTHATFPFDQVKKIRELYAKGSVTQYSLSIRYNVDPSTISRIVNNETRING